MRKRFIAGNWKMFTKVKEAECIVEKLLPKVKDSKADILVCPPFVNIPAVKQIIKDSNIQLGAQNCSDKDWGAYTGEVSAPMLQAIGCQYVIIGHSERRQYFNEDEKIINQKIRLALDNNLKPILCVGESLKQREKDETKLIIEKEIKGALNEIDKSDCLTMTIAYEPIWAIGTGKTASPEQAQEVHKFIRDLLKEMYDEELSENLRILYGGSMKPKNCKELLAKEDIDGGLVGGASLKPDDFAEIINSE